MITFHWIAPGEPSDRAADIVCEVFIDELHADPSHLFDANIGQAYHLLLQLNGSDAATGRLSRIDPTTCLIGCIAVRQPLRKQHLGGMLIRELLAQAARLGYAHVRVLARESAVPFYAHLGFSHTGLHFWEDETEKFWMERGITDET